MAKKNLPAAEPQGNALPHLPPNGAPAQPLTNSAWKSDLDSYEDLRALTFETNSGIDAAIDLLWTEQLRDLPHDLAGGDTLIVPAEAVAYFHRAGIQFVETNVLAPEDLSEDELNRIRGEQGPY